MEPKTIGKYEVLSNLGKGSMGVVYKAQDPEIGRVVAIKTLRTVLLGDDSSGNEALQRFRQESRSAGKLQHQNIVTIFEAGRTESGSPYIVMEFIEGKSLETMLQEQGRLEPLEALHYLAQVASALDYAHQQKVIHRDIKPSNILVDSVFRPRLLDFGVAKLSDTSLTPAGTVVGTPSYMSPEQIRGEELDGSTDLFAFAVVAFEVFTGKRPFPGNDFTTVVSNIIHKEPLSFKEIGAKFPSEFEIQLRKGLSKDRKGRFPSALEFVTAIARTVDCTVDSLGLVGGYRKGMKLSDVFDLGPDLDGDSTVSDSTANGSSPKQQEALSAKNAAPLAAQDEESRKDISEMDIPMTGSGSKKSSAELKAEKVEIRSTPVYPSDTNAGVVGTLAKGFFGFATFMLIAFGAGLFFFPDYLDELKEYARGFQSEDEERSELPPAPQPVKPVNTKPSAKSSPIVVSRPNGDLTTLANSNLGNLSDGEIAYLLTSPETPLDALRAAIRESAKRNNPEYTTLIATQVIHPNFAVRVDVLKALNSVTHYQTDVGFSAIQSRLHDSESIVRGFAGKILGSIGDERSLRSLEGVTKTESDSVVKNIFQQSIDKIKKGRPNP